MALTAAQRAILKADILSDNVLSILPNTNANGDIIAAAYNAVLNAADSVAWKPQTKVSDLFNLIVWANLTPALTVDGTALWTNKVLLCQTKQMALQMLLPNTVPNAMVASGLAGIRAGIKDALTGIPSKNDGTTQGAGYASVEAAMQKLATRAEKLFSTGTGTAANPRDLTFEGLITQNDVTLARDGA